VPKQFKSGSLKQQISQVVCGVAAIDKDDSASPAPLDMNDGAPLWILGSENKLELEANHYEAEPQN
jgi:hypothetical protein